MTEPLSVRARFERFPATVKGAFIVRGEDADPHQIVFRRASLVGIGLGVAHPMPMAAVTLDVVPHRDIFIPFEMAIGELDPGWYSPACELDVDGYVRTYDGGRRFSVPWPRSSVRRGQVKVNRGMAVGDGRVMVEQIDCAGDSIRVHVRVDPPEPLTARLSADGDRLEVLEVDVDETTGRGKVTAYPVMRTHAALRIELHGRGRGAQGTLDVDLSS